MIYHFVHTKQPTVCLFSPLGHQIESIIEAVRGKVEETRNLKNTRRNRVIDDAWAPIWQKTVIMIAAFKGKFDA